jgi:hypothetical protein
MLLQAVLQHLANTGALQALPDDAQWNIRQLLARSAQVPAPAAAAQAAYPAAAMGGLFGSGDAAAAGLLQQAAAAQQLPGGGAAQQGGDVQLPGLLAQLLHHMVAKVLRKPALMHGRAIPSVWPHVCSPL